MGPLAISVAASKWNSYNNGVFDGCSYEVYPGFKIDLGPGYYIFFLRSFIVFVQSRNGAFEKIIHYKKIATKCITQKLLKLKLHQIIGIFHIQKVLKCYFFSY